MSGATGRIHQLRRRDALVCRVQTDLGLDTPYILCAPVLPRAEWGALIPKLHVPILLGGAPHVLLMSQLASIPAEEIGPEVGDVSAWRDEIETALTLLVSGF